MEPLVKPVLVITPWLLSVLVMIPIIVPLLFISSTTIIASIIELIASSVIELVIIVVSMVVLVIKPEMEIFMRLDEKRQKYLR